MSKNQGYTTQSGEDQHLSLRDVEAGNGFDPDRLRRIYDAILSNTQDLTYVFDLAHRFIYANRALLEMWGTTWDEAAGKTCLALGYEAWHAEMYDREIDDVISTRQPVRGTVTLNGKTYDYVLTPVFNAQGNIEAIAGTNRDVTNVEVERQRRDLVGAIADRVVGATDPAAILKQISDIVVSQFGVDRCELIETQRSETAAMSASGDGSGRLGKSKFCHLSSGDDCQTVVIDDTSSPVPSERTSEPFFTNRDWRSYVAVPLIRDGTCVGALAMSQNVPRIWAPRDISLFEAVAEGAWLAIEKLRTEKALRESEERFSKAFSSSPFALSISSVTTGKIVAINESFVDMTGYSRSEAIGRTATELNLWADGQERDLALKRLMEEGRIKEVEYEFRTKENAVVSGILSAELLEIGGRQCALSVVQDVTARKTAEHAHLEAATRFKSLFNSIDQGFCIIEIVKDENGIANDYIFLEVSPSFEKESGMVDVVGRSISEVIPFSTKRWVELFSAVADDHTPVRVVNHIESTGKWFDIYAFHIGTDGSAQVGMLFSDITARKNAEIRLRDSEERFRRVANAAPVMIWVADVAKGCTWFNEPWLAYTGRSLEEELGDGWFEGVHPNDRERCQAIYSSSMEAREPFEMEYRLRRRNGDFGWVIDRGTPLVSAEQSFQGYIGSCIDITERRDVNEALNRQAALIEMAYDPIFVWDLELGIIDWNAGAERLYGYQKAEAMGQISHKMLRTIRQITDAEFHDQLFKDGLWAGDVVHFSRDGQQIVVESRQQLIESNGRRLILESNRDITERKRSEEILDRYRLMSEHSIDMIWFASIDGRFVEVNQAAVDAYGYSREEFLSMNLSDIRHPSAISEFETQLKDANTKGVNFETLHVRKDGLALPVEVRANGADIGDERLIMAIVRDISERKENEETLRRSEQRRQLAQEAGNVGIWDWDIVAGITYWSETMWWFYGESNKAVNPDDTFWSSHLHPSDRDRVKANLDQTVAADGGDSFHDEFRILRSDGSMRWIESKASVSRDPTGRAHRMYGVNLDITERKEAEERVRLSEYQLRVITNAIPALISYTDSSERFRFVNQKFVDWFGKSREELIGRRVKEIVGAKSYKELKAYIDEALAGNEVTFETVLSFRKAGDRYVNISYVPDIGVDGTVFGYYGLTHDLTQLKRSEELLRSSEEKLGLLAESVTDYAIFSTDRSGRIDSWNRGAELIFGYSSDEAIGSSDDMIFPLEDQESDLPSKERKRATLTGRASDERWLMRKDGSRFFASGVLVPLFVGSEMTGYAKIATDLTEKQRRAEQLQRAHDELEHRVKDRTRELAESNEALRLEMHERAAAEQHRVDLLHRLVSSQEFERRRIARDLHDQLGQRLTALRLKIASLKEATGHDADLSARVQRLQEIGERLDSEVSFLAWELRRSALDDLGLVDAVGAYVNEWSRHHDIGADFYSCRVPKRKLDKEAETHIYRIAQEALNNIAKHARASNVTVILEKRGQNLLLIIEDDGVGFDVPALRTPTESGKGLGLLGMSERAVLIGGEVEIESAPSKGTTIYAKVPIA